MILFLLATAAFQTPDEMRVEATGQVWELCVLRNAQSPLDLLPNLTTSEAVEVAAKDCAAFKIDMELAMIRFTPQSLRETGVTGFGAGTVSSLAHKATLDFERKMMARVSAAIDEKRRP